MSNQAPKAIELCAREGCGHPRDKHAFRSIVQTSVCMVVTDEDPRPAGGLKHTFCLCNEFLPASRIASAPPDEFRISHASPEEIKAEMKPSVEACDQPEIVHDSSGNVFADLGLSNAEALKAQSHPSLQESGDRSAEDYRPSKFHLSNSEIRSTGILCGGAVQNIARELLELRTKSPEPSAGPLDVNRERVIEELLAKEGEFPTLFVNILRNWSAEKIGRLAEQLALRGDKPPAEPAFGSLKRYDLERISAGYAGTDHEMQEWPTGEWVKYEDVKALASTPIDLNATREEGWQPMDSAPRDGTRILVDFGRKGVHAVAWEEGTGITIWCVSDGKFDLRPLRGYIESDVKGWMPLPAPPAFVQGIGGKP